MTYPDSILSGVHQLVDDWLLLDFAAEKPLYQHKTACNKVCARETLPSAESFISAGYEQIDANFNLAKNAGYFNPSKANWRSERQSDISSENNSSEVKLERSIVRAASDNWANQVPTSSGLIGPCADKVRNIDLVQRLTDKHYSLIELKVKSNNPLFAAIEILTYGLLFAWSKANMLQLGYESPSRPLLAAESVELCVLAPKEYYQNFNIAVLAESINEGLCQSKQVLGLPFTFLFTRFPDGFSLADSDHTLFEKALDRTQVGQSA